MPSYDVITFGETMLRLTPPAKRRIEQAGHFEIQVGGSESNTAIGLARLGLRVGWLSRLTRNALGRLVAGTIARYDVDTAHIIWTEEDRVGLYFFEEGSTPRRSQVIYDRKQSAMSQIQPQELPAELFYPTGARLLHLTGITPALSQSAAATATHAIGLAKDAGWLVSFDLNYRHKLWSPEQAQQGCEPLLHTADIIFITRDDAWLVYGLSPDLEPTSMLSSVAERYPQATVVMTLGIEGAIGRQPDQTIHHQPIFPAVEIEPIGSGDAFSAGFLYGYLTASHNNQERLIRALRWGAAVAALKCTIPGDIPLIEYGEAEALVSKGGTVATVSR